MADAAFESLGVDELRALLSALGQPVGGAGSAAGLAAQLRQAVPVGEGAEGGDAGAEEEAAVADADLLPPEHLEHLLTDEERDAFEQQGVRSRHPPCPTPSPLRRAPAVPGGEERAGEGGGRRADAGEKT